MHNLKIARLSSELKQLVRKLDQAATELEDLHYPGPFQPRSLDLSANDLLSLAKSLLIVWNARKAFISPALIADPGWNILLNLKVAELQHQKMTISDLCLESGVPNTTALRWIRLLENNGLVCRQRDKFDGRRVFINLIQETSLMLDRYLTGLAGIIATGSKEIAMPTSVDRSRK